MTQPIMNPNETPAGTYDYGTSDALDMYLEDKQNEFAQSTLYSHSSRISHFVEWCDQQGIEYLNELTPPDLHRFKVWRSEDVNKVTLKTQLDTVRVFLRWCESIDAVPPDMADKLLSPTLDSGDNVRDVMLEADRASDILDHLEKYEYASLNHVILLLMVKTGCRIGTLHGMDVSDYDPDTQSIRTKHRPDGGTPLKNKQEGERHISLSQPTCDVLDDYLTDVRPDCVLENDREPLICSESKRLHKTGVRQRIYNITRPCYLSADCPHDRDIDACDASTYDSASKCPSSVSPHAIRRGSITHFLRQDVPTQAVSDRCNVNPDTLSKHYDRRNSEEKMEQRRDFFDQV